MIFLNLKHITRLVFLLALNIFVIHKAAFANESQINSAFARFINLVYLNTETSDGGHKFCVFGSDDISLRFSEIIDKENLRLLGDSLKSSADYKSCRIIYVAKNKQKSVRYSVDILNRSHSLTIATFSTFVNDGGMVFVDVGRRNFELVVNGKVFKESGVRLDSSITGLIVNVRN